jgi:iron complex transport system ATP-binding protein
MLELQSVSGGYGGEPFLADISLSIPEHSVLSIVGPNGCGKSTLLKLIGGIKKTYSETCC